MFQVLKKLLRKRRQSQAEPQSKAPAEACPSANDAPLMSKSLKRNKQSMQDLFREDNDFIIREFEIPLSGGIKAVLFFIDGMVNATAIQASILQPLMLGSRLSGDAGDKRFRSMAELCDEFLASGEINYGTQFSDACAACLIGDTVMMVDGFTEFVCINSKGFERRAVTEPQTETVVRGSREGFTEVLPTNTALIRRKIKSPHLRMETMKIGQRTKTMVCLTYLDNIADPALIDEVRRRLKTIDTDAILNSGYIEEYIEDSPSSLFQTIHYTEKPDVAAAKLLEGRCALLIEGTPFVLTMPILFIECFQSPEDYAVRPYIATFLRIIRLVSFFLCLLAPAVYVALISFHQELFPTTLLFTIAASSEGVPFNSVFETALMLLIFEILKEAGIRLPKPIGQAISIVGALVMGQAAIQAGIVGPPVVIIIAFTGVTSFLIPNVSDALTILRWYLLILAALMGGFGITLGLLTILFHLASLKSFGAPFLSPYAPFQPEGTRDGFVRMPLWTMKTRPAVLKTQDVVRQNMGHPRFEQEYDS